MSKKYDFFIAWSGHNVKKKFSHLQQATGKNSEAIIENLHSTFETGDVETLLTSNTPLIFETLFAQESINKAFPFTFDTLSFDIVLCDDEKIRQINFEYRQKDCATDVITFSLFMDDENKFIHDGTINLGEIFISLDTASRQAKEGGGTFEQEVLTLLTHGILHLLGFDHQNNVDYTFVVGMQEKIIMTLLPF